MTLLVGAVRRGSVCFITMYSVRLRYAAQIAERRHIRKFLLLNLFSVTVCMILVLGLDDAGLVEYRHTFTTQRHTSVVTYAVRLSVRCRTVGRFLENRVVHRFQPVELQLPKLVYTAPGSAAAAAATPGRLQQQPLDGL